MTALTKANLIDDMDGKFVSRLRAHRTSLITSKGRGSDEITVQSSTATLDAKFDIGVLDRLHDPCFVAISRPVSGQDGFLIYEVAGVKATHLQELGIDTSMPKVLREEFLRTIEKGWTDAKENWIDITAVPTGYLAKITDGRVEFSRTKLTPLTGTEAHLLSMEATKEFVCVEDGSEIGTLLGYGIPFTVRIPYMIRYHTGVFGFTGVGKSNLVSFLIREALDLIKDLRVVIFDISGEYVVNLLDKMTEGSIVTTEREILEGANALVESQIVPETLEESVGGAAPIEKALITLHKKGAVRRMDLSTTRLADLTLDLLVSFLNKVVESGKSGATAASVAMMKIGNLVKQHGLDKDTPLRELSGNTAVCSELTSILQEFKSSVHQMSGEAKEADGLLNFLQNPPELVKDSRQESSSSLGPEDLAEEILTRERSGVTVVYSPDPIDARECVTRYVERLLAMKKQGYSKVNVLTVLDEAQEFIPDRTRREDNTESASVAVESLLRQGRKYRAGCWLSTQRVAHLNVNALQQLHSYFASTLPRVYDRMVVADAYSLGYEVLDRLSELEVGEWLFVSYKASKLRNVPVFIKTKNNEEWLIRRLKGLREATPPD
jgi:hypothetical protein